jgi:hypothetical protein
MDGSWWRRLTTAMNLCSCESMTAMPLVDLILCAALTLGGRRNGRWAETGKVGAKVSQGNERLSCG